jgi:flagellar hook-length control protein FliK
MNGLAVEIAGRAHAGKNNFEIRLDPPELGRIEVKLSVDRQGQVTSHLIADRQDTLDLLRRDSTGLERALQDAGLKTAGDGLQFSLRDQSFNGRQSGDERSNASPVVAIDDTLPTAEAVSSGYTRYAGRIGGVDIRV